MVLTDSQNTIASDTHRFRVVAAGRRFGKTQLAVEEIKGKAIAKDTRIAYIAPTYIQARDIAWASLKKEMKPAIISENESRLELRVNNRTGGESLIQLRGWESIESMRGQSFDFLVVDEIAMMRNFWGSWQEVIRPTLTDRKGEVLFISTPKGFNHFYDLFNQEAKDEDYKSFHYTTYDNPHIDKEEVDKAKLEITEDRFAQEYMADFRKAEGLVYKEFNRERHVYEELPEELQIAEVIAGVDFGFTNPAAVITIAIDFRGNYYVESEWYKTGRTEAQIAEYIASQPFRSVYPDPESPSAIEELNQKGVNVRDVIKNKDSVVNGINKVRELFKQNRLKINRSCANLITELESYSYDPDKKEKNRSENPIKSQDHALDALRYALSTHSPVTMAEMYAEHQMVREARDNKVKNSYE